MRYRVFTLLALLQILPIFSYSMNIEEEDSLIVVAFGNSTTAPRREVDSVYSVRLQRIFDSHAMPVKVINSGVGSSHTGSIKDNSFAKVRHGRDRFEEDVIAHSPNWVIINFGLNDSYQDSGEGGEARISLESYRENIEYFIERIEKIDGRVILMTPNPLGSRYEEFRKDQVRRYAAEIEKIAAERDLLLINSWVLFYEDSLNENRTGDIDYLYCDGIHPNDRGHEILAEEIYKKILLYRYIKR